MKSLNEVIIATQGSMWDVKIDEHPMSQTVIFETTTNYTNWRAVNGQRVSGPGPRMGAIWTNAVAGGPAHFRGAFDPGIVAFRVRCTRYESTPIKMTITHGGQSLPVTLIGTDPITFIIEEEKSLEDLLSEL